MNIGYWHIQIRHFLSFFVISWNWLLVDSLDFLPSIDRFYVKKKKNEMTYEVTNNAKQFKM